MERLHGPGCTFVFVVDCKPLYQVTCGHAQLTSPHLQAVFRRICGNLSAILAKGWRPPNIWSDPVMWHRREYNIIANYLANYTMDRKESWSEDFQMALPGGSLTNCQIVAHTDGGTRIAQCSATGWVVELGTQIRDEWQFFKIAMGGTYLTEPISSFTAESLASEECSVFVRRFIDRFG